MNDEAGGAATGKQPEEPSQVRELKIQEAIPEALLRLIHKLQKNYHFFSDMSEEEVSIFLRMCKQEAYDEGNKIFSEGDSADHFYLMVSGEIIISIKGEEVTRLEAGEVFGEMALLESIPRTATATAGQHSVLFYIPVKALSSNMPSLAYKVLLGVAEQMSARLREATEHIKIPKKEAPETEEKEEKGAPETEGKEEG